MYKVQKRKWQHNPLLLSHCQTEGREREKGGKKNLARRWRLPDGPDLRRQPQSQRLQSLGPVNFEKDFDAAFRLEGHDANVVVLVVLRGTGRLGRVGGKRGHYHGFQLPDAREVVVKRYFSEPTTRGMKEKNDQYK